MNTSYGQFTVLYGGNKPSRTTPAAAVLWRLGLALLLGATRVPAAPGEQTVEEKPRSTAAIASALSRLEILQKECVVLTMPEYLLQR